LAEKNADALNKEGSKTVKSRDRTGSSAAGSG